MQHTSFYFKEGYSPSKNYSQAYTPFITVVNWATNRPVRDGIPSHALYFLFLPIGTPFLNLCMTCFRHLSSAERISHSFLFSRANQSPLSLTRILLHVKRGKEEQLGVNKAMKTEGRRMSSLRIRGSSLDRMRVTSRFKCGSNMIPFTF